MPTEHRELITHSEMETTTQRVSTINLPGGLLSHDATGRPVEELFARANEVRRARQSLNPQRRQGLTARFRSMIHR
jgi:hypothetical protein